MQCLYLVVMSCLLSKIELIRVTDLIHMQEIVFDAKGPLHDPVTRYTISYTGVQVAQRDFQNNAPAFGYNKEKYREIVIDIQHNTCVIKRPVRNQ